MFYWEFTGNQTVRNSISEYGYVVKRIYLSTDCLVDQNTEVSQLSSCCPFTYFFLTKSQKISPCLQKASTPHYVSDVRGDVAHTGYRAVSKGAGSGMAGMAAAIPIQNLVWRRHTNQ